MKIIEDNGEWVVLDWTMTPNGWLYAGVEWFDTYQEAWKFVYGEQQ